MKLNVMKFQAMKNSQLRSQIEYQYVALYLRVIFKVLQHSQRRDDFLYSLLVNASFGG